MVEAGDRKTQVISGRHGRRRSAVPTTLRESVRKPAAYTD